MQDVADVLVDAKHQLLHGVEGDGVMAGSGGSDDPVSNQGRLVRVCSPDGVDGVMALEYWTEDRGWQARLQSWHPLPPWPRRGQPSWQGPARTVH